MRGRQSKFVRICTPLFASSILGLGALVDGGTQAAAGAVPHATPAPVLGSAGNGGAVIVVLTNQHSTLNLRTQNAARTNAAHLDQAPIVADIKAHGGSDVLQLVSVNAVAAQVSKAEVQRLRSLPGVAQIIPDGTIKVGDPEPTGPATTNPVTADRAAAQLGRAAGKAKPFNTLGSCGTLASPLVEPEALSLINAPAMTNAGLATEPGHGVIVANDGIDSSTSSDLVGNPNFVRPAADGGGSVVIGAAAGDMTDKTDGEYYGDASSIDAQGTKEYQYTAELPYSNLPSTCYFKIVGDAPGASLLDATSLTTPESAAGDPAGNTVSDAETIEAVDNAVKQHADVINESYGYSNTPGSYATHYTANDAAVAAGVTVVVSSGDSGDSGTVSSPASDPSVIGVGATNAYREIAMAYGYAGWDNNDITPLSSGGATPEDKVVDLVAPGFGGEAACNPAGSDCPANTATEAFGGTSEAAPLVAGAAADVIQAYRDSHQGDSPSPALVKQILTGSATDINSPADQQGAGLVNIGAAVSAAQAITNTTATLTGASLLSTPTQLDVTGGGGTTQNTSVSLYNASGAATTVTSSFRQLGPQTQIGNTVPETVSAPDPTLAVPLDGAQAAPSVNFTVPSGLGRLDADMIWPDATNDSILYFVLFDPQGNVAQMSYDYGTAGTSGHLGTVPDVQHVEVANPQAGTWTAQIKWGNGRGHLQSLPNLPGTYTGGLTFRVAGQNWITSPAGPAVTIASKAHATIPLSIALPTAPGDSPESVQFSGTIGNVLASLPVARRTLIPTAGGEFDTVFNSSVGRGIGGIKTFNLVVPSGQPNLGVTVATPDVSADDPMSLYIVDPTGKVVTHTAVVSGVTHTLTSWPLAAATVNGVSEQTVTANVPNPIAGVYEIDMKLNLTTSGLEFSQDVLGDVLPQAPVISTPTDGSNATTQTPTVSGTGASGDTVTVVDAGGHSLCSTVVTAGAWSCTTTTLAAGPVTLTATQADATNDPSPVSNSVGLNVPSTTTTSLAITPAAPTVGQPVTLTATTTGVPDGTAVTFADNGTAIPGAVADAASGTASYLLSGGLTVGAHSLTAAAAATPSTLPATSPPVSVDVAKKASTIALTLSKATTPYGHSVAGLVAVSATAGDAVVKYGSSTVTVPIGATGKGTFVLPANLAVGSHVITAAYTGTSTVAASGPTSVTLKVTKAPTTTTVKLVAKKVKLGQPEKISVKIGGHSAGAYPAGKLTVTAKVGHHSQTAHVTLAASAHGKGSFTVKLPAFVGTATLVVTYHGNADFTSSKSTAKSVVIKAA